MTGGKDPLQMSTLLVIELPPLYLLFVGGGCRGKEPVLALIGSIVSLCGPVYPQYRPNHVGRPLLFNSNSGGTPNALAIFEPGNACGRPANVASVATPLGTPGEPAGKEAGAIRPALDQTPQPDPWGGGGRWRLATL